MYVAIAPTCPGVRTYVRSSSQEGVRRRCPNSVRIASPAFALAVRGWLRTSALWRTSRPCGPDGLQVPPGCSAGFSAGSPLGFLEDARRVL